MVKALLPYLQKILLGIRKFQELFLGIVSEDCSESKFYTSDVE